MKKKIEKNRQKITKKMENKWKKLIKNKKKIKDYK